MACFLIPAAEALVTTIAGKALEAAAEPQEKTPQATAADGAGTVSKLPFHRKLKWLSNLLWGGSALLAFEHVWHGEIVPYFPFLSAMGDPADAADMLHEMFTAGVAMAAVVTAVWVVMLLVSGAMEKRMEKTQQAAEAEELS